MESIICRICKEPSLFYDEVDFLEPIRSTEKPFKLNTIKAPIYLCTSCNFLMIQPLLPNDFYDGFYFNQIHERLNETRCEQLNKLALMSKDSISCLEIGCGEGLSFPISVGLFKNFTAIEPAKSQFEIALKRANKLNEDGHNINVINSNLESLNIKYPQFTNFYSIMVFEHLIDPIAALKHIKSLLKPGAIGLINVPNGQALLNYGYLPMFPCEHINYFTPLALTKLLQMQGFEIIEISTNLINKTNLYDLSAYVRLPENKIRLFSDALVDAGIRLRELLGNKRNITIWGGGNNAHHYAVLLDKKLNIKNIIDSSDTRTDQYINNLGLKIKKVERSIINESDAILIFASSFNNEIIFELSNNYDFKGLIVGFHNGNVVSFGSKGEPIP